MNQPVEPKNKLAAVLLYVLLIWGLGWVSWAYTYKVDLKKFKFFLITFIINIVIFAVFEPEESLFSEIFTTFLLIWILAAVLWPLINLITRSKEWYENYPNGDPSDQ